MTRIKITKNKQKMENMTSIKIARNIRNMTSKQNQECDEHKAHDKQIN